jgi:hypothetical protein
MPHSLPSFWRRSCSALASSLALLAGAWLLGACGPGVATPMPEPPAAAFDLGGINRDPSPATTELGSVDAGYILGGVNTVPPDATVRITNLDTPSAVAATTADALGAFKAVVFANDGQELRFEWVKDGQRSAPADAIVERPDPAVAVLKIMPAPRFSCLKLTPGFVLSFSGDGTAALGVENGCDGGVTLQNPRTRTNLGDFAVTTALPRPIPAGESASIDVSFTRAAAGLREEVLLVDVVQGATTLRYPITLRAE